MQYDRVVYLLWVEVVAPGSTATKSVYPVSRESSAECASSLYR